MAEVTLTPLTDEEREQFILDNQYAFKYGAILRNKSDRNKRHMVFMKHKQLKTYAF